MNKKIVPGIPRFVSMLFLIFEKVMSKNIAAGILRFVSMLFLIFEKAMSKKIAPGILRFVSMVRFGKCARTVCLLLLLK